MAGRPLEHLLRHLRRVAAPSAGGLTDADLLGRFADNRDEAAFEALVWRHGPLVYGVCRRVLGHTQDAEDAFQASFLILARKSATVRRRGAIGPWLYQVAQRVALRARRGVKVAAPLPDDLAAVHATDPTEAGDLKRIIDEEIGRLPARYRSAVVLHYMEGRTTTDAAIALGCPTGTVLSRLASARRRLRTRLTARGAALPAALAAIGIEEAAGAVPARWVTAVVATAGTFAAGGRSGRPALLAAEVLRTMLIARLRVGAVVVFGVLAAGAGLLVPGMSPGRSDNSDKAALPAVEVTVVRPTRRTAGDYEDFVGQTAASATVEIRSRITGPIEKVAFQAGAKVKRGDLLFELDARPYQVEYERAQAELQRAESHLQRARVDLERVQTMVQTGTVSADESARAKGAVDDAQAGARVAKSGLDRAKLDLDATRITSPIDGQTGGSVLGVGNLAAPTTTLVTIVSSDPTYVSFQMDENTALRVRKLFQSQGVTAQMAMSSENSVTFPYRGKVDYIDNRVEAGTGRASRVVHARAVLPNPGGEVLLGARVRVRLMIGDPREELLIPAAAIRYDTNNQGAFVLVVGTGNVIQWRPIAPGLHDGDRVVVTEGIRPEDRVIVDSRLPAAGVSIRVREADPPK
jgi:RND family efflux transporter MFP subunit